MYVTLDITEVLINPKGPVLIKKNQDENHLRVHCFDLSPSFTYKFCSKSLHLLYTTNTIWVKDEANRAKQRNKGFRQKVCCDLDLSQRNFSQSKILWK